MLRIYLAIAVLLNALALVLSPTGSLGFAVDAVGYASAASSPTGLFAALVAIGGYALVLHPRGTLATTRTAGILRRAVAFLTDCLVAAVALGSVAALLPLLLEAQRQGHFAWSFERTFTTPTDWILGLLVVAAFTFYFAIPAARGADTIGGRLFGVRIVGHDGASLSLGRAYGRVWLAFFAAAAWIVTIPLALLRGTAVLWHDDLTKTRAVRVQVA